jgi:LCP family protein required for cell wall assembly
VATEVGRAATSVDDERAPREAGRPPRRGRRGRVVAAIVLIALGLLLVLAPVWASRQIPRIPVDSLAGSGRPLNVLVVGSDSRVALSADEQRDALAEGGDLGRTDTIFLLSVQGTRAAMLAFPRDLWVERCDGTEGRINAAEPIGGPSCLVQTVQATSGIDVHHYVRVTFEGFVDLVNAVDGVEMCLDEPISDRDAAIDLPAGCQRLDGEDALGFVRVRKIDDDLQRIQRQQRFVRALAEEIVTPSTLLNPVRLVRLTREAGDTIAVDDQAGPIALARIALGGVSLAGGAASTFTVPTDPRITPGGAYVLDARPAEAEALYATFRDGSALGADDEAAPERAEVRLAVLNGANVSGLAGTVADALEDRGYQVVEVGNTEPTSTTLVRHPPGDRRAAELVAGDLPGDPRIEESDAVTLITVVLGPDAAAAA